MKHLKQAAIALLTLAMLSSLGGCNGTTEPATTADTTPSQHESQAAEETEAIDTETVPATVEETVPLLPEDAELVGNPVNNNDDGEKSGETDDADETELAATRIYNYLNGTTVTEEEQAKRPVAIMMNNIKNCLPQDNITAGDIYYECSAEGGITRIMMLVSDYAALGQVGSIRSSRDYFIDFIANHDAIYIHAGGSSMAYETLAARGTDNLDGVNMYIPDMFYRDTTRMYSQGYEHSLMTTGEKIVNGIAFKKYATEHDESFVPAFRFYDETEDYQPVGSIASHVHLDVTPIQTVDFVYNEETKEYLRYQYDGMPQVDGLTKEQLSVKNVIILFTEITLIPGDADGHLNVVTVGKGEGYYITNGRRKVIEWTRENETAPVHLTYKTDGEEVLLNCGKTFICVVDDSVAPTVQFDYSWD